MQAVEYQSYIRFWTENLPLHKRSFGDVHFRRCSFDDCALSGARDPQKMLEIHDVRLENCRMRECDLSRLVLTDVTVENIDMGKDLLCVWGSFFRHVVLRGTNGNINLNGLTYDSRPHLISSALREAFEAARKSFYKNVDWALDIREASVLSISIKGIPANLIRRDPATQAIIRRHRLEGDSWRRVNLEDTWWKVEIEDHLSRGSGDLVIVAPRQDPSFPTQMGGIKRLRDAGIAELD